MRQQQERHYMKLLRAGEMDLACAELLTADSSMTVETAPTWICAICATPQHSDGSLLDLSRSMEPGRAFATVMRLTKSITHADWYTAAKQVQTIRHYAPTTNRSALFRALYDGVSPAPKNNYKYMAALNALLGSYMRPETEDL